jgi:hypothetical protein
MSALETQVNVLASLIGQLATVREVSAANLPVHLRSAIANVSSLAEELASSEVQNALASAEMEQNLKATDLQNSRREIRKRRCVTVGFFPISNLTPGRTQVDATPPAKRPASRKQVYPPRTIGLAYGDLTRDSLPAFVQNFNQANPSVNMNIWTPTDSSTGQNGALRITVPNILVGYISLRSGKGQGSSLKADAVTVTGIREQVRTLTTTCLNVGLNNAAANYF